MKTEKLTEYRKKVESAIDLVNSLREVSDSVNRNEKVKKVAVILCGSRNGSSLLKTVVSGSKDLAYLAGEEEPYFILSKNGFPYNSESDTIEQIDNKQHLLDCIFDELGVNIFTYTVDDFDLAIKNKKHDWYNRLLLQFPLLEVDKDTVEKLWDKSLHVYSKTLEYYDQFNWNECCQIFLRELFRGKQAFGYYDIIPENTPYIFDDVNRMKIEEPPYVIPAWKRQITEEELDDKILFFKTPQDCYRIGIFEELFPNAEIKYVHLSRGFAQTVNGLMDGWLSETGFFAHNMDIIGERLNIEGYTDKVKGGDRWWNFDLPANWKDYKDSPLEDVCLNQWHSAHTSILNSGVDTLRIKFEDFLLNGQETLNILTDYLGINSIKVKKLPLIMITHSPSDYRWYKRKETIMKLAEQPKVKKLMTELGYSMDPLTWI